eukprot:3217421-Alexandrium_andersonii.AAC.1
MAAWKQGAFLVARPSGASEQKSLTAAAPIGESESRISRGIPPAVSMNEKRALTDCKTHGEAGSAARTAM